MGIDYLRPKIAATGAVILEIPGEDGALIKADALASKLRGALGEEVARVTRPVKRADLRIAGLDESVTKPELIVAIASSGGCSQEECRIGEIRRAPSGLGTVWVNCPATAAKKLAETGRMKVGWVMARVEALLPRPLLCFRCLETGHTRARCTAPQDRGNRCYRCGQIGHTARGCTEKLNCPLCLDIGRPAGHRLGGAACAPPQRGKGISRGGWNSQGMHKPPPPGDRQEDTALTISASSRMNEDMSLSPKPRRIRRGKNTEMTEGSVDGALNNTPLPPSPTLDHNRSTPEEAMDVTQ